MRPGIDPLITSDALLAADRSEISSYQYINAREAEGDAGQFVELLERELSNSTI